MRVLTLYPLAEGIDQGRYRKVTTTLESSIRRASGLDVSNLKKKKLKNFRLKKNHFFIFVKPFKYLFVLLNILFYFFLIILK